jgi:acetyl esterase/lipase
MTTTDPSFINTTPRSIWSCAFVALLSLCFLSSVDAATNASLTTIEYKRVGDERLRLDVCAPTNTASSLLTNLRPVVITIHGGGWGSGDRKTDFPTVLQTLTDAGYIYVSMDYRLSPAHRWPACREDVEDAVAWTKTNIAKHGGDPERIAVLGYSAGGQLAFWAAIRDQPPHRLKGVIGLAPATDFLEDLGRRSGPSIALRDLMNCDNGEPFETTLRRLYEASPINHLHEQMPSILLIHGTEDRSVPFQQSLHIQQKIQEKQWRLECEVFKIEGAPHRQTDWEKFDPAYKEKLLDWLGVHLNQPK